MSTSATRPAVAVSPSASTALRLARAGAVFYVLWSVLHVVAAWFILAPALEPLAGIEPGAAHGRIYQNSGLMVTVSLAAIVVAVSLNWRNERVGYWLNLLLVSGTDIAFIAFVLIPGDEPVPNGLVGPALWVIATVLSTAGLLLGRAGVHQRRTSVS